MQTYLDMLAYKRPHLSSSERKFINRFIRPVGVEEDACGNLIKRIDNPDGTPSPVLWSSHTDSVHSKSGKQSVLLCQDGFIRALESDCLGADCATGVWLMLEMIGANVPGLYIFHRGEERGGIGSTFISTKTPELLEGIKFAIAFDRRGFQDVITEQWGGVCCSTVFARSLADQLGMRYQPSPDGVFTDTANYTDIVPECTNISVGYQDEHRSYERQHAGHLIELRDALLRLDVSGLVKVREPKAEYRYDRYDFSRWQPEDDDHDWVDDFYAEQRKAREAFDNTAFRSSTRSRYQRLLDAINDHPDAVASLLEDYGIGADEILGLACGTRMSA